MLLRKKIYQIGLMALVFACGSLFAAGAALAEDPTNPNDYKLEVEFKQTPLFGNEESNFLPGDSVARWVKVTNNTEQVQKIATEAINYFGFPNPANVPDNDLSRALLITIRKKNSGDIYYGGGDKTLFDFYKNGETYLSDIAAAIGSINEYEFEISFPESEGNYWNPENTDERPTTKFDIIVGFQEEDGGGIITPPSSGGGGSIQGLIIKDEEVVTVTDATATIKWWTSYNATSQVVYCKASESCSLDLSDNAGTPPLYGYNYTTGEKDTPANLNGVIYREMIITGLDSGTTYEYRCVSHASPPTVSREHSFTTLALADEHAPSPSPRKDGAGQEGDNDGVIGGIYPKIRGAAGAVSGFISSLFGSKTKDVEGRVAGAEENKIADESKAGENETGIVKPAAETGNEIASECGKYPEYLLWLIVLLLLVIMILLYHIYQNKKRTQRIDNA